MSTTALVRIASLATLLAACGCMREIKFATRELPGFSVSLPEGTVTGPSQLEYGAGTVTIKGKEQVRVVIVHWQVGGKVTAAELQGMLEVAGPLMRGTGPGTVTTESGPDGRPIETVRFPTDKVPVHVSQIECGGRNLLVSSMSESDGDAHHRRIVRSIACKPDPASEQALGDGGGDLQLELPGWFASRDGNRLSLSDGRSLLYLEPMPTTTSDSALAPVIAVFANALEGVLTGGAAVDGVVPITGTIGGEPVVGWTRLVRCPRSKVLALALAPDATAARAIAAAVDGATCHPVGARPQVWPDPPAGASPSPGAMGG